MTLRAIVTGGHLCLTKHKLSSVSKIILLWNNFCFIWLFGFFSWFRLVWFEIYFFNFRSLLILASQSSPGFVPGSVSSICVGICSDSVVLSKPKFGRPCTAPILVKTFRSESGTLPRFVTNLAGKPFDDSVPDEWKRHQLAHTTAENMSFTSILARASRSERSTLSRFVTNLAGKPFDNSIPDEWKRHQLAHTAAENMSYTTILARASSSESSTVSRLAFSQKKNLGGKDTNWLTMRINICYCVTTYQGTYAQTLMANQCNESSTSLSAYNWILYFEKRGLNIYHPTGSPPAPDFVQIQRRMRQSS